MTFTQFIKQLTSEQVNTWWQTMAPNQAPEKVEEENWKYKLIKNGKALPFKWSIAELAKYYNIEFSNKDFDSNVANRDAFCEAFDFDILEDLVYDDNESKAFQEFYSKRVTNKDVFQSFINYANQLIEKNAIPPYKIRMALTSDKKKATLILGMRAVLQYTESSKIAIIGLILEKDFAETLNKNSIESVYPFSGKDISKSFITTSINHWSEISKEILENNILSVKEQFELIKKSKRVTWNTEANSTNSVLKYLIFKNENVESWIKNNKVNVMGNIRYWALGFGSGEYYTRLEKFKNENYWQALDYDESDISNVAKRARQKFNQIKVSDLIIIKGYGGNHDIVVHYKGKVKEIIPNEYKLILEKIDGNLYNGKAPKGDGAGNWRDTIVEVKRNDDINLLFFDNNLSLNDNSENSTSMRTQFKKSLNQILYGPPGTGKTYNSINKAIEIINPNFDLTQDRETVKKEFDRLVAEGQIVFTTFHQSMAYEDFIEGIKPKTVSNTVHYEIEEGLFKVVCQKARTKNGNFDSVIEAFKKDVSEIDGKPPLTINAPNSSFDVVYRGTNVFYIQPHNSSKDNPWYPVNISNIQIAFDTNNYDKLYNPTYIKGILGHLISNYKLVNGENQNNKNYVLIIDEINRGNVSQVFGELITLIEESKRLGKDEAIEVILPYSKEKFGVPANLYIIGTMNTADRSVEALDTALRRRFSFVEMMPNVKIVDSLSFTDTYDRKGIMQKINQRIEALLDRNYTLGHSYFIKEDFKNSFENEIIPLLQEYFYNDYGKIGLVLGKGFVKEKAITAKNDKSIFADFDTKNEVDVIKSYELIPFAEINFDEAIKTLLA